MAVMGNLEEARAQVGQEGACLREEEREISVMVHPQYTREQVAGVRKELDALCRRHNHQLGGMVVAYDKVQLVSAQGWLFDTNPYVHMRVVARFIVFSPTVGDTLKAVVRKKSKHHLGCLAHGSFNVSVPRPPSEPAGAWGGTLAAEGDTLSLSVLFTSLTKYHMPFIRAALHPDCIKELKERAEAAGTAVASAEDGLETLPNQRTVFDNDSGISSNEAEDNANPNKRKRSQEEEEEEEGERKKKKKKKGVDDDGKESDTKRGRKRKRKEEEEEREKKKKKREDSQGSSSIDTKNDSETSPSKRKKKKKKKKDEGEKKEEGRETFNPLIQIKMERESSDEGKKRKKKKTEEDEGMMMMMMGRQHIKQEKTDDTEGKKKKKSRFDVDGDERLGTAVEIKREMTARSDEGQTTMGGENNLPVPLFMIKKERTTPEHRVKIKAKKEKG